MPPLITTPTREASIACKACGSTLVRTGQPTTWADTKSTLINTTVSPRVLKPFRGWVPSLLITICPKCDVRDEKRGFPSDVTELPDTEEA